MQTSLMFVDLQPLGVTPNSQKIAIKMPEGAEGFNVNEDPVFSDMINALMTITPEQLQSSFGEMEWVKVQGESAGYAPLLDLSTAQAKGADMAQMLFGETVQRNLQQTKPLGLGLNPDQMSLLDSERTGFVKSKIEQLDAQNPNRNLDFSKGAIPQSLLNSTKEEMLKSDLEPGKGADLSAIKTIQNNSGHRQPAAVRSQIPTSHVPAPAPAAASEDAVLKPSLNEDTLMDKGVTQSVGPKASSENVGSDPKVQTAATLLPEEMKQKSVKPNDPVMARVAAIQNDAKASLSDEPATGHQFEERHEPDAEQILRRGSKERPSSGTLRQNFNVFQGDGSSGATNDGTDPLGNDKQDNRSLFQQVVSRINGPSVKSVETVEHVSGHHEPTAGSSDTQSNVIRQIVQRMSLHNQGSQSTMTLKLKPAFLGNVHMQISTDNQQIVVRMATESAAVKEMVEQGLQHLKTEMQHHGLEIDKFDVFVTDDNEDSHPGQDLAGFRQALKKRQQNSMDNGQNSSRDNQDEISEKQVEERHATINASEIDYFA